MNQTTNYVVSGLLALALHAGVIGMLVASWTDETSLPVTEIKPYYIEASVVSENPHEARKRKAAEQDQKRERQRRETERKEAARKQQRIREQQEKERILNQEEQQAQDNRSELARLKAIEEAEQRATEEAQQEQERSEREAQLALAILEEQTLRRAITDDEKAMAYVAQIQREIIQNWSRPPSARNGMQALLRVFLVPTGEVVDVVVEESSGNASFDRSAMLAVTKSERFVVPGESRQFERNFREFTVLFRPEDLRL